MKLSCSSSLLSAAGADSIVKMVMLAAKTGYSGIQIECAAKNKNSTISPDNFSFRKSSEFVLAASDAGIELHSLNTDLFEELYPPPLNNPVNLLKKYISIAHSLACPLVCFSTPTFEKPRDFDKKYKETIDIIKEASDFAEEFDICLAVKPKPKALTENIDEAIDFIDDSECKNIGLVYCPGIYSGLQKKKAETTPEILKIAKGYLILVQIDNITKNSELIKQIIGSGFNEYLCDYSSGLTGNISQKLENNIDFLKKLLKKTTVLEHDSSDDFIKVVSKKEIL